MSQKKMEVTPEGIKKLVNAAYAEWMEKQGGAEHIHEQVFYLLDSVVEQLLMTLLGFEGDWGKWEVKRSENREHTAAGLFLSQCVKEGAEAWLLEQAGNLPPLPRKAAEGLKKVYLDEYYEALTRHLVELAQERAAKDVERYARMCGIAEESPDEVKNSHEADVAGDT